ncbi:acyl-CoA dehydrogenase family protein [Streptomyces plumbiresistens]|uniref:Acyl-[acyl-carrier-protein] dehydrogenase MbtN n=1 Tax=Streptomyces plumbiresistens TaxID=511811 RepID=A0ABP7TFG5_9ACTN
MRKRRFSWADDDIEALHDMATAFFHKELLPHEERFAAQKHVDRDLWWKAGEVGLLCAAVPEEYGGGGGTHAHDFAIFDAQYRLGASSLGLIAHTGLVSPYLTTYGTEEQKRRWLPRMARGEYVAGIAMTEPGAGSDLKMLRTTARRDGDSYVINGAKTFISNGALADLLIVAVKTDPAAGPRGISLVVVETKDAPGFSVGRTLDKVGMRGQDTAELFFDDVRVPADNMLGDEGSGFGYLMKQLAHERLVVAVVAAADTEAAVSEAVDYTKQRQAFGGSLFDLQNTRFELAECRTLAEVSRTFVDRCVEEHLVDELDGVTASMAKAFSTDVQGQVIDRCLQLFGGYGYMLEYPIARRFIDARIQRIYGGANEIMKELIARSL